ncbi:hypothetical protein FOCC_FOCC003110 [Frankliniella occidentalis]|nr:hypothetical protein FOCC_FOCC003110 [Frankliniella occidentalis]
MGADRAARAPRCAAASCSPVPAEKRKGRKTFPGAQLRVKWSKSRCGGQSVRVRCTLGGAQLPAASLHPLPGAQLPAASLHPLPGAQLRAELEAARVRVYMPGRGGGG